MAFSKSIGLAVHPQVVVPGTIFLSYNFDTKPLNTVFLPNSITTMVSGLDVKVGGKAINSDVVDQSVTGIAPPVGRGVNTTRYLRMRFPAVPTSVYNAAESAVRFSPSTISTLFNLGGANLPKRLNPNVGTSATGGWYCRWFMYIPTLTMQTLCSALGDQNKFWLYRPASAQAGGIVAWYLSTCYPTGSGGLYPGSGATPQLQIYSDSSAVTPTGIHNLIDDGAFDHGRFKYYGDYWIEVQCRLCTTGVNGVSSQEWWVGRPGNAKLIVSEIDHSAVCPYPNIGGGATQANEHFGGGNDSDNNPFRVGFTVLDSISQNLNTDVQCFVDGFACANRFINSWE